MDGEIRKNAAVTFCREYRLWLTRDWAFGKPTLAFLMLNPSTADSSVDDPTIRRCIGYAKREGRGGIEVVNLFALRATDPGELLTHEDPVGRDAVGNDAAIMDTAITETEIVCAWGNLKNREQIARAREVVEMIKPITTLLCLGTTKNGMPRHPLYVKADQPLERWTWPEDIA